MDRDSDDGRFERLYREYYEQVRGFFRYKGFPGVEAEDLTQDTFERVYRGLKGFRGESSPRTWIFKIARNVFLNAIRYQSADKRDEDEVSLEQSLEQGRLLVRPDGSFSGGSRADPEADLLHDERTRLLRGAIDELPPKMRRCVLLRVYDRQLKYREVAVVMNVSVETVKSQIHQAKARLREILGPRFEGDVDF